MQGEKRGPFTAERQELVLWRTMGSLDHSLGAEDALLQEAPGASSLPEDHPRTGVGQVVCALLMSVLDTESCDNWGCTS